MGKRSIPSDSRGIPTACQWRVTCIARCLATRATILRAPPSIPSSAPAISASAIPTSRRNRGRAAGTAPSGTASSGTAPASSCNACSVAAASSASSPSPTTLSDRGRNDRESGCQRTTLHGAMKSTAPQHVCAVHASVHRAPPPYHVGAHLVGAPDPRPPVPPATNASRRSASVPTVLATSSLLGAKRSTRTSRGFISRA